MIKSTIAALAAAPLFAGAAMAGPYVNVETNSGFYGNDYRGSTTDVHAGYEGESGDAKWYVQGGPTLVSPDSGATETELGVKVGGSIAVAENVDLYGRVSLITGSENTYKTKVGVKYRF